MKISIGEYDDYDLYTNHDLELKPGLTVLVGRNGVGKTTLMKILKMLSKKGDFYYIGYDNYREGGSQATSRYGFYGDVQNIAQSLMNSEGQNIFDNFDELGCRQIVPFVAEKTPDKKPIIIGLDALDSGMDIEGIEQVKDFCTGLLKRFKEKEIYILVSANSFCFVEGSNCLDVKHLKPCVFKQYEDFKKFILEQYEEERKNRQGQ